MQPTSILPPISILLNEVRISSNVGTETPKIKKNLIILQSVRESINKLNTVGKFITILESHETNKEALNLLEEFEKVLTTSGSSPAPVDSSLPFEDWAERELQKDLMKLYLELKNALFSIRTCEVQYKSGKKFCGQVRYNRRKEAYELHGKGTLVRKDGSKYIGDFREGSMDGKGQCVWPNGNKYEGGMKCGRSHGEGELHFKNCVVKGSFSDGVLTGPATCTYPDGMVYHGELKEDIIRDGPGRCTWLNGNKYEGDWKDDNPHGKGTMTLKNGNVYTGHWEGGQLTGEGKMVTAEGVMYEGQFRNNVPHGKGMMKEPDRKEKHTYNKNIFYDGHFKEGRMHGYGTRRFRNGDIYEGMWENNKMHGKGIYKTVGGMIFDVEWHENKIGSSGKCTWPNGNTYEGGFSNQKKSGVGELTWNGITYKGSFQNGSRHGKFTVTDKEHNMTSCWFENDKQLDKKRKRDDADDGQNDSQTSKEPLSDVKKGCGYEKCGTKNPFRFYFINEHCVAGRKDWSALGGRDLCESCYNRYLETESLVPKSEKMQVSKKQKKMQ